MNGTARSSSLPPSSAHRAWLVATAGLMLAASFGLAWEEKSISHDPEAYWAPFCGPLFLIPPHWLAGVPFWVVPGCFAVYLLVTGIFAWIWKRPLVIYLYTATTVPAVLLGALWVIARHME